MLNLIIDQGNSVTKIALFQNDEMKNIFMYKELNRDCIDSIFDEYPIDCAILSTVREIEEEIVACLKNKSQNFIFLNGETPLPVQNNYKTPNTLGADRIAAIVAANNIKPNSSLLVIDVGTAITYDYASEGIYYGGNITPGLKMRFRALHFFTSKLPLCEKEGTCLLMGEDTDTAIRSGVMNGILYEIEGTVAALRNNKPDLFVFLTGGDAFFFESKLKIPIFADKFLVLKGLNRILKYNVEI